MTKTPPPTTDEENMNEQNPYGFTQELLDLLAKTSGDMYDCFYDFLATFQFDFSLEEKTWLPWPHGSERRLPP